MVQHKDGQIPACPVVSKCFRTLKGQTCISSLFSCNAPVLTHKKIDFKFSVVNCRTERIKGKLAVIIALVEACVGLNDTVCIQIVSVSPGVSDFSHFEERSCYRAWLRMSCCSIAPC